MYAFYDMKYLIFYAHNNASFVIEYLNKSNLRFNQLTPFQENIFIYQLKNQTKKFWAAQQIEKKAFSDLRLNLEL